MNAFMSCASLSKGFAAAFAVGVAIASTNAHGMEDLRVRVVNHTGQSIVALYVSHDYDRPPGPNRLNLDELPSRSSVLIDPYDLNPGCWYDFLAVMEDHTMSLQEVNACYISRIVFG